MLSIFNWKHIQLSKIFSRDLKLTDLVSTAPRAGRCCSTAVRRSATEEMVTAGRRGRMERQRERITWNSRSRVL